MVELFETRFGALREREAEIALMQRRSIDAAATLDETTGKRRPILVQAPTEDVRASELTAGSSRRVR